MKFEDAQEEYYRLTKQNVTKEEFLESLLKAINEIDELVNEVKSSIAIAKIVLNRMYNSVNSNCNFEVRVEEAKITIDILGKLIKSKTNNEIEKAFINSIVAVLKRNIDNRSKQCNYNRKNMW